MSVRIAFRGKVWRVEGAAGWRFVTVPAQESDQIRRLSQGLRNPFGSVRVIASIADASWRTSVFFDTKADAYLLPLKAEIRRKQEIADGDEALVTLELAL